MAALSPPTDENARKIAQTIFQALSRVGQNHVAQALGVSDATISRMKDDLPRAAGMLSILGLKVVPSTMKCYEEKTLAAVLELAHQRMAQLSSVQQLQQDWDAE